MTTMAVITVPQGPTVQNSFRCRFNPTPGLPKLPLYEDEFDRLFQTNEISPFSCQLENLVSRSADKKEVGPPYA